MREIFVFGSNEAGIHGAGAARYAVQRHGAIYNQGVGLQGTSYAIPTKDHNINTLPIYKIKQYVDEFIKFAEQNPEQRFNVTAIGCGLAGYTPDEIAPLFTTAPGNCIIPRSFAGIIEWDGETWES